MKFNLLPVIAGALSVFGIADVSAMDPASYAQCVALSEQHEALKSFTSETQLAYQQQQVKMAKKVAQEVRESRSSSSTDISRIIESVSQPGGMAKTVYDIGQALATASADGISLEQKTAALATVATLSSVIPDNFMEGKNCITGADFGANIRELLQYTATTDEGRADTLTALIANLASDSIRATPTNQGDMWNNVVAESGKITAYVGLHFSHSFTVDKVLSDLKKVISLTGDSFDAFALRVAQGLVLELVKLEDLGLATDTPAEEEE